MENNTLTEFDKMIIARFALGALSPDAQEGAVQKLFASILQDVVVDFANILDDEKQSQFDEVLGRQEPQEIINFMTSHDPGFSEKVARSVEVLAQKNDLLMAEMRR